MVPFAATVGATSTSGGADTVAGPAKAVMVVPAFAWDQALDTGNYFGVELSLMSNALSTSNGFDFTGIFINPRFE